MRALEVLKVPGASAAGAFALGLGFALARARLGHARLLSCSCCVLILDKPNHLVKKISENRNCLAFGKAE
jgi:hypothetical protein